MVKPSIWRAATAVDLVLQGLRCSFINLLSTRHVVHVKERVPEADIINRVAVVVHQDVAVKARVELDVYVLLNERSVFIILCPLVGELHGRKQRGDGIGVRGLDAVLDLAVGHPFQVARLPVERAWGDL